MVNRGYLHMVFHCLFGHLDSRISLETKDDNQEKLWNLACDVAMESIIDTLYQKCVYIHPSAQRREFYLTAEKQGIDSFYSRGNLPCFKRNEFVRPRTE